MSYKITATCDKCKKEETKNGKYFTEKRDGYQEVEIKISNYQSKTYSFCADCRKELGLIQTEVTKFGPTVQSVEERLLDAICEIVAGELEAANRKV